MKKFTEGLTSESKFKVSLDLHGVIDAMPDFFAFFTKAIIDSGGELHIVTGGATEKDKELLKKYNIQYTHFFSITDYHKEKGTPTTKPHPKYGFMMVSDEIWDKTKGDYCRKEGIDLHIDDTLAYNDYFTTPFARLWSHNRHPKSIDKDPRHID